LLKDCIEIFKENYDKKGERYILDSYVPKDGTYMIVRKNGKEFKPEEPFDIRYDKKKKIVEGCENSRFQAICFYDYYSKLIEMNKPMDSSKMIHTNNYLSFAVKKESLKDKKITQKIIEGYYQNIAEPETKYKKTKSRNLYLDIEKKLGKVDAELLMAIERWVCENIYKLDIDKERKDYLKIFFVLENEEITRALYKQEGMRYIIPNLYNSNDFNVDINGEIFGLPNNNMGMNSKKPFLENKTRGAIKQPYLLNSEDVFIQAQFFDYLMGLASKRQYNVYLDTEERTISGYGNREKPDIGMTGYFLRLSKEKNEVGIQAFDTITNYNPNIKPNFKYKIFIKADNEDQNRRISKRIELEQLIDEVIFSRCLINNYFTDPSDIMMNDGVLKESILIARDRLRLWFNGDESNDISAMIDDISCQLTKDSVGSGYFKKAKRQLNLRWSLYDYFKGSNEKEEMMNRIEEAMRNHVRMEEGTWEFDDDDEYYFAVGQMIDYFISKSNTSKKPLSFANRFLNIRDGDKIKEELNKLFKKYNHDMFPYEKRANRILSRILLYKPESGVNEEMMSAGILSDNVIFEKHQGK